MDTPQRQPVSPLIQSLLHKPHYYSFFVAVRAAEMLLEAKSDVGQGSAPNEESVRFQASTNLSFPGSDLARAEWSGKLDEPLNLTVTFLGLHGVSSPLPAYFQQFTASDAPGADALRDFLTLFNQRMLGLFYRAWKRGRVADEWHTRSQERARLFVGTLGGLARTRRNGITSRSDRLLGGVSFLGAATRSAAGLERLVADYFLLPTRVEQRVAHYRENPAPAQLGNRLQQLGRTVVIGTRVKDVMQSFRISLGPINIEQARNLLPTGDAGSSLSELVHGFVRDPHFYELRLELETNGVSGVALGASAYPLGWLSWLANPVGKHETVGLGWHES